MMWYQPNGSDALWQKVMAAYCRVYDFVICGLTAYDWDQLWTQRSYTSMGYLFNNDLALVIRVKWKQ